MTYLLSFGKVPGHFLLWTCLFLLLGRGACIAGGFAGPGYWASDKLSRIPVSVLKMNVSHLPFYTMTQDAQSVRLILIVMILFGVMDRNNA